MLVFPLLQLGALVLACVAIPDHPWLAAGLVALAALALNFSVHVCFHEWIHRGSAGELESLAFTLILGSPFDGYRLHHNNHHAHENGPLDYSSTWKFASGTRTPRSVVGYALGWPAQLVRAARDLASEQPSIEVDPAVRARARRQKRVLATALLVLAVWSWQRLLVYLATVYLGWAVVAVQNFGQHPPIDGEPITSFRSRLYNLVFFNNGLHYEHHAQPGKTWDQLQPRAGALVAEVPHLAVPFSLPPQEAR